MRSRIDVADGRRAVDEALLLDHVEDGERSRLRYRVADVRAADRRVAGRVHDLRAAEHAGERQAAGDRLRDDHQVRLDAVVLDREHPAGAAEAGLNLVDDQHDAVLVADAANARHELRRADDEAAFALHRLDDDRRHLLGGHLGHECALERSRAPRPRPGRGSRSRTERGRPRARTGQGRPCTGCVFEVSVIASSVRPWKPPSNAITAGRCVYARANLTAFSTASAPELKNAAFVGAEIGASAQSRSASST